ncbi:type IV secretion system protein VirB6 [Pseudomonas saponiphila]|uniref:Type IV secretion system protein VirB6 n=1 Tax=Pseudomonas saponiphila TaxID=556534 RepID=A0A1H5AFE6_9PSED|nr:type IV secretion system protein [Pseudomonas saponiphila]SED41146.1 type IV secretion system protein VirB6 [Pseudomonas saponiphila]
MAYNATTQIFSYMDEVSKELVASNVATIIAAVTPLVALGLTIVLMVEGTFKLYGGDGEPLTDMLKKFAFWGLILSISSAGGWYQKELADVALKTPDEFASILIVDGKSGSNVQNEVASTIDKALENGLKTAQKAFDNAGVTSGAGLASFLLAAAVLLSTVLVCGIGAALILMAKFMLAIAVCFGPIFIMCLMFDSLRELFSKWIGSVINFGLITILLSATFGLLMKFYGKAVASAADPAANLPILVPIITCGLLTVVTWFVLKKIPDLAASWGSGVSVQFAPGRQRPGKGGGGQGAGGGGKGGAGAGSGAGAAGAGGGAAAAGAGGAAAGAAGAAASAVGSAMQGMARGSRRAG